MKCIGTVANRAAIGAKIRVQATIGGRSFWQMRELNAGGGCARPLVAHFGLGDATKVETIRVEWPGGTVQELHDLAPKQILTVTEPARLLAAATNGVPRYFLKGRRGFQYEVQASVDLMGWSSLGSVTITDFGGTTPIVVPSPALSDHTFYRAVSR